MKTHKITTKTTVLFTLLAALGTAVAEDSVNKDNFKTKILTENTKIFPIEDGQTQLKFSFFENIPTDVVTAIKSQYNNEDDPGLTTSINTFLIQIPEHTILVDTGGGKCMGDKAGHTVATLANLSVATDKIDTVLLTHAHTDHFCGLATQNTSDETWSPNYPNATIYVNQAEYDYWINSENGQQVKAIFDSYRSKNPDSIKTFKAGERILDAFDTVETYGHTVGHTAFLWQPKAGEQWLFWGDVMHNAEMQFAHPEITIKFDTDANQAKDTRVSIMQKAVENNWYIAGAHLPFPGIGHIESKESGFNWVALKDFD